LTTIKITLCGKARRHRLQRLAPCPKEAEANVYGCTSALCVGGAHATRTI